MKSSNLSLARYRLLRSPSWSWPWICAALLVPCVSTACTARCRPGLVLRDGLCHPAQPAAVDAGDGAIDSADSGASTATRKQAATAAEPGVRKGNEDAAAPAMRVRDAGMRARMDPDAGTTSAMMKPSSKDPVCGDGVREGAELCDGDDCKQRADCKSSKACIVSTLTGAAKTCDAECTTTKIEACKSGDGCCPDGCDHGTDDDCSPSCGDGVLTGKETCEPGSSQHPCPTFESCDDGDPCTEDSVTGSARQCSAECVNAPLTRKRMDCDDQDPCTDDEEVKSTTACTYECRNSAPRKPTGSCVDSDPCTDDTPMMSKTACKYECPHALVKAGTPCGNGRMCNASGRCEAPPAVCGDGVVAAPEECDPAAAGATPFNCSRLCRRQTVYTPCKTNDDCLNGTVCGLELCTRACQGVSDCDFLSEYPDLQLRCPQPRGTQCVIQCDSSAGCPPGTTCNGAGVCQGP